MTSSAAISPTAAASGTARRGAKNASRGDSACSPGAITAAEERRRGQRPAARHPRRSAAREAKASTSRSIARLRVADRDQADDADQIAHLRRRSPNRSRSARSAAKPVMPRPWTSITSLVRSKAGRTPSCGGVEDADAGQRLQAAAGVFGEGDRPRQQFFTVQGELAAAGVDRGEDRRRRAGRVDHADRRRRRRPGSTRGPWTWRTAAWVRLPRTLWVLATAPSTPLAIAEGGRAGWKWKCGPHASST